MQGWLLALLTAAAGAALIVGAKVGAWWRGRSAARERAQLEQRAGQAELERDVQQGRADVAGAQAEALTDHVERQAAGAGTAQEVRDAAREAGPDPDAALAAAEQWVRERHAGARGGEAAGGRATARVRDGAPAERPSAGRRR